MADKKPIFALDLSNEGIALWHRKGSSWIALGQVSLSDPEFEMRLIELRDKAPVRGRTAVVRIPRSEVMLSRVRLGVFEGEAAASHARKQIENLTPYTMDQIAYDLGEKGAGNTAPVAVVARKTLQEAEDFARSHGFDPVHFTTQYAANEFPREPRFYTADPQPARAVLGWVVPWVAAAAIGMTAGFLGYSWLSGPTTAVTTALERPAAPATDIVDTPAPTQVAEPEEDPAPAVEETEVAAVTQDVLAADSLSDIAPQLPPVARDLAEPREGRHPDILTAPATRFASLTAPDQLRLVADHPARPAVAVASLAEKTNALAIKEARRDLPEVKLNDEIVALLQDQMVLLDQAPPATADGIAFARLTLPAQTSHDIVPVALAPTGESKAELSERVTALPDRPPPPKSLVTAEPGTLTPTPEGTLGPGNILIFSGRPPNAPLARPGSEIAPPAPDPLAGFKPRLRPEGLAPVEAVEEAAPEPEAQANDLLAQADPTLRGARPRGRPDGLVSPETVARFAPLDGLLAQADPALRGKRPSLRPEALATTTLVAESAEPLVDANDPAPVAQVDPSAEAPQLATTPEADAPSSGEAPVETAMAVPEAAPTVDAAPSTETAADTPAEVDALSETVVDLLALADPALRGKTPRGRPAGLGAAAPAQPDGLLAQADPSLRGAVPRLRPDSLTVPTEETDRSESAEPATTTAEADNGLPVADPALADKRARLRPATLSLLGTEPAPTTAAIAEAVTEAIAESQTPETDAGAQTLLALADPALSGKRARVRPSGLAADFVASDAPEADLLASADPSLRAQRARARPSNLTVFTAEPVADPEPETPENTLSSATRYAVAASPGPRLRPGKIARVASRVTAAQQRSERASSNTAASTNSRDDGTSVAAGSGTTRATARTPRAARGTAKPAPGPTPRSVARAATEKSKFRKSRLSLVGVFGSASARRALVRLPTGRYVKVKAGDRVSGWKVSAIGESSLRIQKGGRNQTLRVP